MLLNNIIMKVAVIGGGHIAGACIAGFLKSDSGDLEIWVTARSEKTLGKYASMPVKATTDNAAAAKDADMVMFCVKTAQMEEAVASVRPLLMGKTVVSMAAQVSPADMQKMIGENTELVYVIPNTAAAFGQSITFISPVSASDASLRKVENLFRKVGPISTVSMDMLPAGITLASCGIGYALEYIAASAKGGTELGFTREEAVRIVTQTVLGAATVQMNSGDTPEQEVRKVATPGGLTERGVNRMEEKGFTEAVIEGLKASM